MKRVLSFMLAFIMVLSLVPVVNAAEETALTGLTVDGLAVTAGNTMMWDYQNEQLDGSAPSGSDISWQASGSQIVATLTPGNSNQAGATLTFRNELEIPATLRFQYTLTQEAAYAEVRDLEGKAVAKSFELELKAGGTYTMIVISPDPWVSKVPAVLTITGLSLSTGGDVTATFMPVVDGTYTVNGQEITEVTNKTEAVGTPYSVSVTAASGYLFFGWYNGSEYISYKADTTITVSENCTIYPVFVEDTVAVFGVGEARYQSLTEADAAATNGIVKTIVLMNNGTLTGEHTISAGNTLLIPYDDANSVHTVATSTAVQTADSKWENRVWEQPTAYRTLTMANGAKLTIKGNLNVGGRHSAGPFLTAGSPSGKLGMIQMAEGSNITIDNGAVLYCWGYIYGGGTVTAKNGATVHENIQFADFRGGNATAGIAMSFLVFPMTQYYVQNIEVATTYEFGAVEEVWGSIYVLNKVWGTSVKFIGADPKDSMFVPGTDGTVTKTFIPEKDRLQLDVHGGGSINPMTLIMEGSPFDKDNPLDTRTFVLPITNNMSINVKSGNTQLNQSLGLLPGTELTIANGAVLQVNEGEVLTDEETGEPVLYSAGHNLIVYKRDQWFQGWVETEDGVALVDTYLVYNGKRLQPVAYSVTGTYKRTEADLVDAVLDINGTLITDGFVYTTVNVEEDLESELGMKFVGNAPIISSGETGKVVMNNGAGQDMMTMQATQQDTYPVFVSLFMVPARLQNADGTYLETMGAESGATFTYCADCNHWFADDKDTEDKLEHTCKIEITWIVDLKNVTQEFDYGTQPVYTDGTNPVKEGYEFIGWSTGNDNVPEFTSANLPEATTDATYFACFQEKAAEGMLGDLDGDGEVTAVDLTLLACHVGGIEEITDETALANADVNGDGVIDAKDLTVHACYVGGIISDWKDYT